MSSTRIRSRARYYLVQRLKRNTYGGGTGFDAAFTCDYMGSAEFEYGAIPASLKRIRAGRVTTREVEATRGGRTWFVYFVGPAAGIDEKIADFHTWVELGGRAKERTDCPVVDDGYRITSDTIAWWSLNDDIAWTLDPAVATDLLAAFTTRPAKR